MSADESTGPPLPAARIRLQKFLASCGLGSRRACEQFITDGRVAVDGRVVDQLGATVDPSRQRIALDGEPLRIERKKYFALYKPRGVVCTNRDPAGRPRVIDLLPPGGPRLFPVGRLDAESEGLILVTNDGDLAQKLAHPRYRIYRKYLVQVAGVPNRPALDRLREGEHFAEGRFRVHSARLLKKQGQSGHVEVVLSEGQNREVRRLFARIGHKVMRLKRVAFGPIQLGRLSRGEHRPLTTAELTELHAILQRNVAAGTGRPRPPKPATGDPRVPREERRERSPSPPERTPGRPGKRPASLEQRKSKPPGKPGDGRTANVGRSSRRPGKPKPGRGAARGRHRSR